MRAKVIFSFGEKLPECEGALLVSDALLSVTQAQRRYAVFWEHSLVWPPNIVELLNDERRSRP